jgi:hypothetical protein
MEFDVVFIADAREGVLPDLRARDSLLGTRHLSPSLSGDDRAYAVSHQEERGSPTPPCARRPTGWCGPARQFLDHTDGARGEVLLVSDGRRATIGPRPGGRPLPRPEAWLRRHIAACHPTVDRLSAQALATHDPWRPDRSRLRRVLPWLTPGLGPERSHRARRIPMRPAAALRRALRISMADQYADLG